MQHDHRSGTKIDRLGYIALVALVFLLPVFFVPVLEVPFQFTKIAIAALVALGGLALYAFGRLGDRTVAIPMHPAFLGLSLIALAYLLSTVFSGQPAVSLLGERIEPDTFGFIAIGVVLAFLATAYLRRASDILGMYSGLLAAGGLLALFQIGRFLFGGTAFNFGGVFASSSATFLGTLHDSAIYFGLIAVLSLITMVLLPMGKVTRLVVSLSLLVSLAILVVVNLTFVWIIVGCFALGTFVYSLFMQSGGFRFKRRKSEDAITGDSSATETARGELSFMSLIVIVLAFVFGVWGGSGISQFIWSKIDVGQVDVRPSWQTTLAIARPTFSEHFLFGSGPGTFDKQWALHRPELLNQTIAWNTDFAAGVGFVPTSIITTGILGFLAWLTFFGLFLASGYAALMHKREGDTIAEFLTISTFLGAAYLWVVASLSNPAPVLILLAFLLTGMFLASLRFKNRFPERLIDFSSNPRVGFLAALALTVLFLGSLAAFIGIGQRYIAGYYFQKALVTIGTKGDVDAAAANVDTALSLYESDRMYRLATDVGLARLNRVAAQTAQPTAEDRQRFQEELSRTVNLARRATEIDPNDYANWLSLGAIYQSLVPLNIEGSYENAKRALETASARRPNSPSILLAQAYLERSAKNLPGATAFAEQSLKTRPIYTEAIFLLAQIAVEEKNLPAAIQRVEAATALEPANPVVYFQLGLLRYANNDFAGAGAALSRAVELNSEYANARYFLGLAYSKLNRPQEAIAQFQEVQRLNPDNQEVAAILTNLRAGQPPLAEVSGSTTIEERSGPPLESADDSLDGESDAVIGEEEE